MTERREVRIPVLDFTVGASRWDAGDVVVALAHGAGGNRHTPALVALARALAESGRTCVLYDFPYAERRVRRPDAPDVLEKVVGGVAAHLRDAGARKLVLGGRSMGGRIASQAVAAGLPADGLVFHAYPLHPPNQFRKKRDRHLPAITAPMLFLQGTRDPFARPDLLDGLEERLGAAATVHRVEGGDHSFAVLKRSGRTPEDVEREIHATLLGWLDAQGL